MKTRKMNKKKRRPTDQTDPSIAPPGPWLSSVGVVEPQRPSPSSSEPYTWAAQCFEARAHNRVFEAAATRPPLFDWRHRSIAKSFVATLDCFFSSVERAGCQPLHQAFLVDLLTLVFVPELVSVYRPHFDLFAYIVVRSSSMPLEVPLSCSCGHAFSFTWSCVYKQPSQFWGKMNVRFSTTKRTRHDRNSALVYRIDSYDSAPSQGVCAQPSSELHLETLNI